MKRRLAYLCGALLALACSGETFSSTEADDVPPADDIMEDDMADDIMADDMVDDVADDVMENDMPPADDMPPPEGILPETRLSELTEEQRSLVCQDLLDAFDEGVDNQRFLEVICTLNSWADSGGDLLQCQEAYDTCVNRPIKPKLSVVAQVDCTEYTPLDDACIMVGELRSCFVDFGTAFEMAFSQLRTNPRTCEEAQTNPPEQLGGEVVVATPAGCESVMGQACGPG